MRRAAEDRAGAVLHQDEVRDVDRQLPVRIERMDRLDAGVEAHLLRGVDLSYGLYLYAWPMQQLVAMYHWVSRPASFIASASPLGVT